MKDRKNKILELLTNKQKIEVADLAQMLGVSQVTVRKDLDALAETGIIKREHGFAVLQDANEIAGRLAYHYEEKKKIAARAARLISDGDTIMIESGSCCAILAETLAKTMTSLTIITNSAFIADYIRNNTSFQIILLGGIYQHDSQVTVGPMVKTCASSFFVKHFFAGVDGWSTKTGFTNKDTMRAQAVRDMAAQADQVVFLTESAKLSKHGTVPLALSNKSIWVITDKKINKKSLASMEKQGVKVVMV